MFLVEIIGHFYSRERSRKHLVTSVCFIDEGTKAGRRVLLRAHSEGAARLLSPMCSVPKADPFSTPRCVLSFVAMGWGSPTPVLKYSYISPQKWFLIPALGIDYGASRFAVCRVQGTIAGDTDAPCRGAERGRSGCMSQSSQEKRVISFASPTDFWEKATTKFRGGCRTCEHVSFSPSQSLCESGAGGLGVLLSPDKQILTEA